MNAGDWKVRCIVAVAAVGPACASCANVILPATSTQQINEVWDVDPSHEHLPATLTQQVYEVWDKDIYVDAETGSTPTHNRLLPLKLIAHNGRVIVSSFINGSGTDGVRGQDGYRNSLADYQNPTAGTPGLKAYDVLIISDSQSLSGIPRPRGVEITRDQYWNGGDGGAPGNPYHGQHLASDWCAEKWDASHGVLGASAGRGGNLTIESSGPVVISASILAKGGNGGSGGTAGQGFWPDCRNGDARDGKPGGIGGFVKITMFDGADVFLDSAGFDLRGGWGGDGGDAADGNGDAARTPGGQGAHGGNGAVGGYFKIIGSAPGTDARIENTSFDLSGGFAGGGGDGGVGSGNEVRTVTCPSGDGQCVVFHASSGGQGGQTGNGGNGGNFTVSLSAADTIEFDPTVEIRSDGGGFSYYPGDAGSSRVDLGLTDCEEGPDCPVAITPVGLPASAETAGNAGNITIDAGIMILAADMYCYLMGGSGDNLSGPGMVGADGVVLCCDGEVVDFNGGQGKNGANGGNGGQLTINALPIFDEWQVFAWVCAGLGGDGGDGGTYFGFGGIAGQNGISGSYLLKDFGFQDVQSCETRTPVQGNQDQTTPNCY